MTISGPSLHKGQQRAVELIQGPSKYIAVVAPRQVGKTFLSMQCLLFWSINHPGSTIFFCSPTYQQAKKVMEDLYKAIGDSGIVKSFHQSDNWISLKNESKIWFKSTERADNLRGYTVDFMVVDEAAYHQEEVWNGVLKPMLNVKGKKCLFISTPKGSNWFKTMYDLGQLEDHPDYASCRMHYSENPYLDQKDLDEAKRTLPDHLFQSEYEGRFTESGQSVFTLKDELFVSNWPRSYGKIYCGVDLGKANDWTVATFMDENGHVIEIYRDNRKDWSTMVQQIIERLKKWKATCEVEVNSIGDVIYEQIKEEWQDTHPFVTTNKSKNEIIEGLAVDLNDLNLKLPSKEVFEPLYFELEVYEYQWSTKSRSITYNAPAPYHDDCVMSLAIANHCRKTKKEVGKYTYLKRNSGTGGITYLS